MWYLSNCFYIVLVIRKMLGRVCVLLPFVLPLMQGRLCGPDAECECSTYVINCEGVELNKMPIFERNTSIDVVYYNLKNNYLTTIDKYLSKLNWPNLKVCIYISLS